MSQSLRVTRFRYFAQLCTTLAVTPPLTLPEKLFIALVLAVGTGAIVLAAWRYFPEVF